MSRLGSSLNHTSAQQGKERETSCPPNCNKHMLRLQLPQSSKQLPRELSARLCRPTKDNRPNLLLPKPNLLQEVHYPMFIQQRNIPRVKQSGMEYQQQFEKWKNSHISHLDLSIKNTPDLQPPKIKNHYCHVCRQGFVEYADHIASAKHREEIDNSPITALIDKHIKRYLPLFPEEEEDGYAKALVQAAEKMRKLHRLFVRITKRGTRRT